MKITDIVRGTSPRGRPFVSIMIETSRGNMGEIITWANGSCALNSIQSLWGWSDEDFLELIDWLPELWTHCRVFGNGVLPSHDMKCFLYTNGDPFLKSNVKFLTHPKVKKVLTVPNHAHGGHPVSTYLIDVS